MKTTRGQLDAATMWALRIGLATALATAGCARVGPPGGGPEDTTAPEIVSTEPADGATEVAADTSLRLVFSEDMDRVSAERAFSVEPALELRSLGWEGATLVALPREALSDSTTFTVKTEATAKDYHGVAMASPFSFTFSTGPSIDTGVIGGTVTLLGDPIAGATVWACSRPPSAEGRDSIGPCRYAALTDEDGTFRITGVAASETPYSLFVFVDEDGDGRYSVGDERGQISDMAAVIDGQGASAEGLVIETAFPADEVPLELMEEEE